MSRGTRLSATAVAARRSCALRRARAVTVALAAVSAVAACGSSVPAASAFTVGTTKTCLVHQKHLPQGAYRGGMSANTGLELHFLAYFTAQGSEPYCDGKPATKDDRAWSALYAQLTGHPVPTEPPS